LVFFKVGSRLPALPVAGCLHALRSLAAAADTDLLKHTIVIVIEHLYSATQRFRSTPEPKSMLSLAN